MAAPPTVVVEAASLDNEEAYKLLVGAVVPRPVAWVASLNPEGKVNLAPFSCFTFVSNDPPLLAISVGRRKGGQKDTPRNIESAKEFVVHIAHESQVVEVHESSVEHPPEVSEAELLGLETVPSRHVKVPRLAAAPVAMECRHVQTLDFGRLRTQLVIGEVLCFHVAEDLWTGKRIDAERFRPVTRLGGPRYAKLGEILTLRAIAVSPRTPS